MDKILLNPIYQVVIYLIGIVLSILTSKIMGGRWLPENKFSFHPSALFPAPILVAGILAPLLEFFSLKFPVFVLISIVLGVAVGAITMLYLKVTYPT